MNKMHSIQDLFDFVNRFSTEPTLSWKVPHLYDKSIIYQVHWMYDKTTELNWYIKKQDEDVWKNATGEELLKIMVDEQADLLNFELEIMKVICIQAVCADFYINKAKELIGDKEIESAISIVKNILGSEKKVPRLRLVKKKIDD